MSNWDIKYQHFYIDDLIVVFVNFSNFTVLLAFFDSFVQGWNKKAKNGNNNINGIHIIDDNNDNSKRYFVDINQLRIGGLLASYENISHIDVASKYSQACAAQ